MREELVNFPAINDICFEGQVFSGAKLQPDSRDLKTAWELRLALKEKKELLLAKHPRLKLQISADGGNTFGENMDPRLQDWGKSMTETVKLEQQLLRAKPTVFVNNRNPQEIENNLTAIHDVISAVISWSQLPSIKTVPGEEDIIKIQGGPPARIYHGKNKEELDIDHADSHYLIYFDKEGQPETFSLVDLERQRKERGKSDHYRNEYCTNIPFCFLAIQENADYLTMLREDIQITSGK